MTAHPQDLTPARLVVGVGTRRGAGMESLRTALADCLQAAGARTRDIAAIVTIEGKQAEPALLELADLLSVPLAGLPAEQLAEQDVPTPSATTERHVGTPSVAEAAVLALGGRLLGPRHVGKGVTVAVGALPQRTDRPADPPTLPGLQIAGHPATTEIDLRLMQEAFVDLGHHGDDEVGPGLVNLAENVRSGGPPPWLAKRLADSMTDLAHYPDPSHAVAAVAERHGRPPEQVLLTAGGAEAFTLLARALAPRCAVVVHPQFTEPEAAFVAAGFRVHRVVLPPPFRLSGAPVPNEADVVVVGNPTNPTSVLHPASEVLALAKPGRILVVDEAFMDAVPGEPESLAGTALRPPPDVPGVVVVRSLTKTWGLAGLRVGYVVGDPEVLAALAAAQPLWAVSTPALAALEACSDPAAVPRAGDWARALGAPRDHLVALLEQVPGVRVVPDPRASFVLFQVSGPAGPDVHRRMRRNGWALRRADTFPGLGPGWLRTAVRDRATNEGLVAALTGIIAGAARSVG